MSASHRGVGEYHTGEGHLLLAPTRWRRDGGTVGVIYLHGATQTELQMIDGTLVGIRTICFAIAAAGWPVLGIYAAGDTWGNDTAKARILEGITFLQGLGARPGPVALLGASMGGCNAVSFTGTNPSAVCCAVGLVPVSDLEDMRANNRGGLAGSVDAAYGGAYNNATHGLDHNPTVLAANGDLDTVPYACWYGATDDIVIPSTVTGAVANMALGTATSVVGDHNTSLANIPPADVVSFLREHAR